VVTLGGSERESLERQHKALTEKLIELRRKNRVSGRPEQGKLVSKIKGIERQLINPELPLEER
jgi:hypothetical protein